jgi:hypothetical protein
MGHLWVFDLLSDRHQARGELGNSLFHVCCIVERLHELLVALADGLINLALITGGEARTEECVDLQWRTFNE